MSLVWVCITESDDEEIQTVRIEQPLDYEVPEPGILRSKVGIIGAVLAVIGWGGFAWLMWCVVARVAR